MATGRRPKPHRCSWDNKLIEGLYRMPGTRPRWRYRTPEGKVVVFDEHDERAAVARFLSQHRVETVTLYEKRVDVHAIDVTSAAPQQIVVTVPEDPSKESVTISKTAPGNEQWAWMRRELLTRPDYCAKMTGIAALSQLPYLNVPKDPLAVAEVIKVYTEHNPGSEKSRREALAAFNLLVEHAAAKTLADFTQEKLLSFREKIEKAVPGPATRKAYYGRIKSVISFGLKIGLDHAQIRATLDRCKILWTAAPLPSVQPRPISREQFHKLLATKGGAWRSWLLLGLNLCLHMEEVCALRWADFDLEKGTYAAIREKTRRARIPRAAVLWPETLEVLRKLPRRSEYLFTSTHGTRYNKNTRINHFAGLRDELSLPKELTFDSIRDGAYTAACQGAADERWARVLAGHRSPGLQDNYVLRNPEAVRPACDAVYREYGPFPYSAKDSSRETTG